MSEDKDRRITRQSLKDLKDSQARPSRRSASHPHGHPEHSKRCFICESSAEYETHTPRRRTSRSSSASSRTAGPSGPSKTPRTRRSPAASSSKLRAEDQPDCEPLSNRDPTLLAGSPLSSPVKHELSPGPSEGFDTKLDAFTLGVDSDIDIKSEVGTLPDFDIIESFSDTARDLGEQNISIELESIPLPVSEADFPTEDFDATYFVVEHGKHTLSEHTELTLPTTSSHTASCEAHQAVAITTTEQQIFSKPTATLASQAKQSPTVSRAPIPTAPVVTPAKPTVLGATSHPSAQIPYQPRMTSGGPLTRLQAQNVGTLDSGHRQVSAANIDEGTLDQCFRIRPKWHYIKSNHDETSTWLESASFESVLLELLYFAHDQGHIQHKESESQFEKELERAIGSIEKLDCLDAFCKTFIREGRFRPAGKVTLSTSNKDDKHSRLFRMINSDLQNLQRQHRILSMVCSGTADHEVHTQAQRENLRKLVEDLVTIVHPGDRGTYSEVYKVITEIASHDQRLIKPQLSSVKLVAHPDIVVPFGGPIMAGGSHVRCDALEQKIRAKLPSLLIKMHFSDKSPDQKWPDLTKGDDSGMISAIDGSLHQDDPSLPSGTSTPTGTGSASRGKGKDRPDDRSTKGTPPPPSSSRSGKRKQADDEAPRSKRHREDINAGYDTQPPEAHVINEVYSEHVAQLICALTQSPLGYIKHCKYNVAPSDDRDGTASVTVLGMIVSGEDVYLTKLDASHDYLDSLVETFRMDQLSFSCLANPLNLYKGTHLKALLMFLRYVCLNFPRTTYFLSD